PGVKNPFLPVQFVNTRSPIDLQDLPGTGTGQRHLGPPYDNTGRVLVGGPLPTDFVKPPAAPFPPTIPPTPARRLLQIPDNFNTAMTTGFSSNASILGQVDAADHIAVNNAYTATPQ